MSVAISHSSSLKLSICITTFNRANFIGATLDSILVQLTEDCEVLVLDAGSTDETERLLSEYVHRFDHLRYIRQSENNGVDQDYDRVVEFARGDYCWLMSDDDLIKEGAVASILRALHPNVSLTIVNAEFMDRNMSRVLQPRWLNFEEDRVYRSDEMDRLFLEVNDILQYIGCVVIRREIWLQRERKRYFGSWFIYLGVIFQEALPGEVLVIAEPLISYRMGNAHTWSLRRTEILFAGWPSLVCSFAISGTVKARVQSAEPWKNPRYLLMLRGLGLYSLRECRKWVYPRMRSIWKKFIPTFVALLPGKAVNTFFVLYYSIGTQRGGALAAMKESRFHFRNWLFLKK